MKVKRFIKILFSILLIFSNLGSLVAFSEEEAIPDPNTDAEAAIALDVDTGEVILSKNADEKMYPASITKLMTALILAETNQDRQKRFRISEKALEVEPYSINTNLFILYEGDTISAEDAMKAILLASANDMAVVVAEGVAGTTDKFVQLMNNRAQELGMTNTHFENPIGLHNENHYSTARDIALLMKAAYENPWIKEVLALPSAEINTENQPIGSIANTNINVGKNGNIGGKTGFTEEAGKCLTTIYDRDGRKIIMVLLNDGSYFESDYIVKDMISFADEAYKAPKVTLVKADEPMEPIEVTYKLFRWFGPEKKVLLKISPTENIQYYRNSYNEKFKKFLVAPIPNLNVFNLKAGDKVADVTLDVDNAGQKAIAISNSTTFDSIFMPNAVTYIFTILGLGLFLLLIGTISIKLLRSSKTAQIKARKKRQERRRKATRFKTDDDL